MKSSLLADMGEPRVLAPDELPVGLSEMRVEPQCVYVWGELPPAPWVSIVGTRTPSRQGFRDAFLLARRLAKCGVTVASGGALGVDSAAHLGALSGRGATVVVAPTWLKSAYPVKNHRLFKKILQSGGAYLTVSEERVKPLKFAFFRRNEALMALSHATVLGECPHQSGAKNAMVYARRLGRPRFALPFRFGDSRAQGTCTEINAEGAQLVADELPILALLEEYGTFEGSGWQQHLGAPGTRAQGGRAGDDLDGSADIAGAGLSSEQVQVVRAVRSGMSTVDDLCERTRLSPEAVQHTVLLLTLSGLLREDERGLLRYHSPPYERT